jgi:hypothetical protein
MLPIAAVLFLQASADWPTLHGDLQRSGFMPQFPAEGLKIAWRKELWRELTGPRAEIIVGGGLALLGSYAGKLRAWDAATGAERWVFESQGPIGHSPAYDAGTVYVGSMDRRLYAVDAATGKARWSVECDEGIWSSPAVHAGRVYVGDRGGVFRALSAADGKVLWTYRAGAPFLSSPSISEDGAWVVFVAEDLKVVCASTKDGAVRWISRKLAGLSARDHFPVLVGGLALVTTNPVRGFHSIMDEHQNLLLKRAGVSGKETRYVAGTPEDVRLEQEFIVGRLRSHPEEQVFYAFRMEDGREPWIAPVFYTAGLHNPHAPPCVNKASGEVFLFVRSAYGVWDGGGEVRPYTGVGRLDLKTGRIGLVEHAWKPKEPGRGAGIKDMPWMTFNSIGDETQTLSCSADWLVCNHQGYLGGMSFKTGLTRNLFGKRDTYGGFYGPGTFGWEDQGGLEKAKAAGQPFGLVNEWHGPAKSIASVAGGRVYFHTGSQLLCLEGR